MKPRMQIILPDQEEIVAAFLNGIAPLTTAAMCSQPLTIANRISTAVANGTGRLELIAVMGKDGALHLELTARLPDGDRRLVTVRR